MEAMYDMKDFIILEECSVGNLNHEIKLLMEQGWIPLYPHVVAIGVRTNYSIGMYLPEEEEDELPNGMEEYKDKREGRF